MLAPMRTQIQTRTPGSEKLVRKAKQVDRTRNVRPIVEAKPANQRIPELQLRKVRSAPSVRSQAISNKTAGQRTPPNGRCKGKLAKTLLLAVEADNHRACKWQARITAAIAKQEGRGYNNWGLDSGFSGYSLLLC